jgi:large subunit ribosomal protein L21
VRQSEDQEKNKMKFAIVESGGKQYRAVEGGTIDVDRLPNQAGEELTLEQVLLLADGDNVAVGAPTVKGASIKATVVEHFKGEKVITFHYKPKKRIRQKTGHRQQYTRLSIETINGK